MNEVSKARSESLLGVYESPIVVEVINFQSEGILCASVIGSGHDNFTVGGEYDL